MSNQFSEQARFNRAGRRSGGDRKFKILIPAPQKPYTAEERQKCLTEVYEKCKAKRPDLTPEQFVEELEAGKILIQTPQGIVTLGE